MKGFCSDVTSDSGLKLFTNFPCLPRETGKGRALEVDPSALEIDALGSISSALGSTSSALPLK